MGNVPKITTFALIDTGQEAGTECRFLEFLCHLLNSKTLHFYGNICVFLWAVCAACDWNNSHEEPKPTGVRSENHCCSADSFSFELSEYRLYSSILGTQFNLRIIMSLSSLDAE